MKQGYYSSLVGSSDEDVRQQCSSDDGGYDRDDDSGDDAGYDTDLESSDDEECSIAELIQQNQSKELDRRLSSSVEKLSDARLNSHLFCSIQRGQLDCVKAFIKHGANMHATAFVGSDCVSPFYMAAYLSPDCDSPSDDHAQILGFLIQHQRQANQLIDCIFGQCLVQSQLELQGVKDKVTTYLSNLK